MNNGIICFKWAEYLINTFDIQYHKFFIDFSASDCHPSHGRTWKREVKVAFRQQRGSSSDDEDGCLSLFLGIEIKVGLDSDS